LKCPDCGKALPAYGAAADGSAAAGGQVQQTPAPAQQLQPAAMPMAQQGAGPTESPDNPQVLRPLAMPVHGGAHYAAPRPPVGLAVASMVCGIVSLVSCPICFFPMGVLGLLLGTAGAMMGVISQIKRLGGTGMAVAGVITGIVGALLSLVMLTITGFFMWGASAGAPPPPSPAVSGVAVSARGQAPGSGSDEASIPGQAPTVMSGQQVAEALTGPLDLPKDPIQAEKELDAAITLYPLRGQGEPKFHDEADMLYRCVQSFRRHLARAGLAKPANPEHARMFRTACDELVDRVLAAYRQAGQFEQDGKWDLARKAYGEMMKHMPDSGNPLARNALSHAAWCKWKETHPKKEDDAEPPNGQDSF